MASPHKRKLHRFAAFGEGTCFLINAITYTAVIVSLLLMKIERKKVRLRTAKVWHELKEGFRYAAGFAPFGISC